MIDGKTIELRNPVYTSTGLIDIEVNHPEYGWIPFTANPLDSMSYGKDIYDRALALNPPSYVPAPPEVPASVSPYQARVALLTAGLLDSLNTLMAQRRVDPAAKIAWEYATVWERNSTFIVSLGPALGLTDKQIDDLFIAAGKVM